MPTLTGREKATIFLSILGAETSARLLRYLPNELADLVASGVNHLPKPSPKAIAEILDELRSFVSLPAGGKASGAAPSAKPPAGAAAPAPPPPPSPPPEPEKPKTPKEKFEQASSRKLAGVLLYERPQVIAFVLSMIPAEKQLEILSNLPGQRPLVESLLREYKSNIFTEEVKFKIVNNFSGKL
jgi:flagellar motor switch protein FliG